MKQLIIAIIILIVLLLAGYVKAVEMSASVGESEYYTCTDRCELKCYEKFVY